MTDILETLRKAAEQSGGLPSITVRNLLHHASDCIEDLRDEIKDAEGNLNNGSKNAHEEIERLNVELAKSLVLFDKISERADILQHENERLNQSIKWEQNRAERIGTHAPGCWAWGHRHYECAMRYIEDLNNAVKNPPIELVGKTMLNSKEAQRFLGLTRSTFQRGVRKGTLPQPNYITPRTPRWLIANLQNFKGGPSK